MLAGLRVLDASVHDVRAILLTHWHSDHSAGAQAMQALTGAPVYYHPADEPHFTGAAGATGVRRWVSDRIPEVGVLVLFKGLLGESAPRAVSAQHFVQGGTPGHTPGHVSYSYRPARALFAGGALAVINGEIRFMARPVTLDQNAGRASPERCLPQRPRIVCPGHREPLIDAIRVVCERMRRYLAAGGKWPLL